VTKLYGQKLLRAVNEIHKSGIALVDVSPTNILVCNGEFKFIDVGFAKLYANILDHVNNINFVFGMLLYRSPWAHIVSEVPSHLYKLFTTWNLKEKFVLELIANDYWSLALIFGSKFCGLHAEQWYIQFTNRIDDARLTHNASELTNILQNDIFNLFREDQINTQCPEIFQSILKSILHVNPVIRMQNVENILNANNKYEMN